MIRCYNRDGVCLLRGTGSLLTYEVLYLSIFRKSVEKIQVLLKSDKNNGYFTWLPVYIYDNISLDSS
jgi:hypothetical protein